MDNIAIKVEGLGKRYRIGHRPRYKTFRESITSAITSPLRRLRRQSEVSDGRDTFWALNNIDFEVHRGECVGIIGRNGAGKSTLLKVLSRITEPTQGRVEIAGRVGSLLEVGTGFHPELTGRENVFLNGAILGMKRGEIARKFDAIVAFADVEQFLDTPVKHFSSGMYTRLAFAVAAFLEPDVLIVDEVLAVGDAQFQNKCLKKMDSVGKEGRTVLFVSHSMPMILRLCTRAIMLDHGSIKANGSTSEVTRQYLHEGGNRAAERAWASPDDAPGDNVARLSAVRILDETDTVSEEIDIRRPFFIQVEYWNYPSRQKPTVSIHVINEDGIRLFCSNDFSNKSWWTADRPPGLVRATCSVPGNFLAEGRFYVLASVCSYNPNVVHAIENDAVSFQVVDQSTGDGVRGPFSGHWPGVLRPALDWEVTYDHSRITTT